MKLNELMDNPKARQNSKRRGQGIGSGLGKTSGRGHKGYKSRSGASLNGFEGGQTPIHMRLPKRGFSNRRFENRYAMVNVGKLQEAVDKGLLQAGDALNAKILKEKGVIRHVYKGLRVLGKGELKVNLTIEAAHASRKASEAIQAAGGEIKIIAVEKEKAPESSKEESFKDESSGESQNPEEV